MTALACGAVPVLTDLRYGKHPQQTGDLHLPDGDGPFGVVVLWHGGSFLAEYGRNMMAPLAAELARRGMAAYNATYRRLGAGGGVPATFDDALAATGALAGFDAPLDLSERPAGIGLSAGAPLALHAAASGRLSRVVDLAGVAGLALAAQAKDDSSVLRLFGASPADAPDLYARFDPMAQPPLEVPALVLHGDADDVVPVEMSRVYAEHSGARLVVVPGADHYGVHGQEAPAPPELFAFLRA